MAKKLCKIEDTNACAKMIAEELLNSPSNLQASVLGLSGDLGSGKTTFVKALAAAFGVSETVVSPTFVIMKSYVPTGHLPKGDKLCPYGTSPGGRQTMSLRDISRRETTNLKRLVHIDAYRLDSEDELRRLGWDEILSKPENLIVIEWPEKVRGLLPKDAREIKFKFIDDTTREISFN